MRKSLYCFFFLTLILTAASPKLRIGYYGHSMFEIVLPSGIRIIADPFDPVNFAPGLDFPEGVEADIVTVSHGHYDHAYWEGVSGSPDVIYATSGTSHGIDFTAVPTQHYPGSDEGENNMIIWEAEGFKFAHTGSYGDWLSEGDRTALAGTTFLFFSFGGNAGMGESQSPDSVISEAQPVVTFPIHYRTPESIGFWLNLRSLEEANADITHPIVEFDDAWIAVDADNLLEGPVVWEPAYSAMLPADLKIGSLSLGEGPPYSMTATIQNGSSNPSDEAMVTRIIYDSSSFILSDTGSISGLDGDAVFDYEFPSWTPPHLLGKYSIHFEVICPADDAPQNDTASLLIDFSSDVTESEIFIEPLLETRWLSRDVLLIEYAGADTELAIYDVTGSEVGNLAVSQSPGTISYPIDHLPKGLYFVRLRSPEGSLTRKFTVIR